MKGFMYYDWGNILLWHVVSIDIYIFRRTESWNNPIIGLKTELREMNRKRKKILIKARIYETSASSGKLEPGGLILSIRV